MTVGELAAMSGPPDVTVILPTYNRASFLPQAFASITAQTLDSWHLVVVDDGSTDDTKSIVERFARSCAQPVEYVFQSNRGPAAARNAGLDRAVGTHTAFFDSDDFWLPGYLERSVRALDACPDVDWVFSPCRMVDFATGTELESNTFRIGGRPLPFLDLKVESRAGGLNAIVDPRTLEYQLREGIPCGAQNSVFRRRVFALRRFVEQLRVCEDQVLTMCALADGRRLGYFLDPLVTYHVHDDNSSLSARQNSAEKRIEVFGTFVRFLEQFRSELPLTVREGRALNERLAEDYFWHLGYNGLWQAGRRREAIEAYLRSLSLSPWSLRRWKTFLLAKARVFLNRPQP